MTTVDATNPLDDRFIDRIVDGALTPAELRVAIDSLDREADGWKRCAFAFLEAQCWRESFQVLGAPAKSAVASRSMFVPSAARIKPDRRWVRGPIAAAILAASFAMGWIGHAARPWSGALTNPIATSDVVHNSAVGVPQPEPANSQSASRPVPVQLAAWRAGDERSIRTASEAVRTVGQVHIGTQDTGADVPILAGPGINEQWLRNQPPPVNEYGQVALRRQGYQVDQRRQFITTTLADGRRVTVPVDQVQIRYTGNNPL
jgi:hypothetical protein